MLTGLGISGWKKNVQNITGKPDVAFLNQKVAIFVDDCPHCQRKLPKRIMHIGKERLSAILS